MEPFDRCYSSNTGDPSHMLKVYIQASKLSIYRKYPGGFGVHDGIGTDPTFGDRIRSIFQ
jgi:hypothetical protein